MAEKKLDYQFVEEDVWGSDAILASNPLGKVPCLVMEGGEAVFDSRVIVEYLDARSPLARLIPEPNRERTEVRTWEALADGIIDAAILARLEANWPGRTRRAALAGLDRPADEEGRRRRSRRSPTGLAAKPWCTGIHMTLADVAVGCALGYLDFRFPQIAWRERLPEPGAPGRQAERAPELHRHRAAARLITPRRWRRGVERRRGGAGARDDARRRRHRRTR